MKILVMNTLDSRYGSTYRIRRFLNFLKEENYETIYSESNYKSGKNEIGIKQEDNFLSYIISSIKRFYYCITLKYDKILIIKLNLLVIPCIISAKIRSKSIILDWDDLSSSFQTSYLRRTLTSFLENSFLVNLIDVITTHNKYMIDFSKKKSDKKIFYVPQGVDTKIFDRRLYKKSNLKKELKLNNKIILAFVATFTQGGVRDFDIILKSMKEVQNKNRKIVLLVIGDGPLLEKYKKMSEQLDIENIKFIGRIPHKKVPEYLSISNYGIIFMRNDIGNKMRVSLKILEYLSMEIPVIGHLVGETKDKLERFCTLSKQSHSSLAEKILKLPKKKESPRKFIMENYDWEVVKRKILVAIEST